MSGDRAAGYGRSSSDKQEKSCSQQHDWAVQKAQSLKLDLVTWEDDDGIPGDRLDRPGLERIFAKLEWHQKAGRPISVLLAFDQDRLSRATSWATGAIMQRLTALGVERLVTSSKDIDLLDDTQRAMFGIEQDLSKRACSKAISKNVCRGMVSQAAAGYWAGGIPPYGYRAAGEKKARILIPGPAVEVTAVKELFHIAAQGDLGVCALAILANEQGWPVPEGCRLRQPLSAGRQAPCWTGNTVHRILRNPAYVGMFCFGKRRQGKYHQATAGEPLERRRVRQEKAPPVLVQRRHEPLVDPATFDRVQAVLDSRYFGKQGRRRLHFALSGKLVCDCCGATMSLSKKDKLFDYVCGSWRNYGTCARNSVQEADLLDKVVDLISRELSTKATLKKLRKNLEAARSGRGETLKLAVKQGQAHVADLARKVEQGGSRLLSISADLVPLAEKELRRLKAELETAQKDLAELEGQSSEAQTQAQDIEDLLARLEALPAVLARADAQERGRIVRLAVASIRLRFEVSVGPTGRRQSHWTGATVTLRGAGCTTHEIPVARPRRTLTDGPPAIERQVDPTPGPRAPPGGLSPAPEALPRPLPLWPSAAGRARLGTAPRQSYGRSCPISAGGPGGCRARSACVGAIPR
jgi:site-specific DNA recombinase